METHSQGRIHKGTAWIWLSAAAVALALLMILTLLLILLLRGGAHFWPAPITALTYLEQDGRETPLLVQTLRRQSVPAQQLYEAGITDFGRDGHIERQLVRLGQRELAGDDLRWLLLPQIQQAQQPAQVWVLERRRWGPLFAYPHQLRQGDQTLAEAGADGFAEQVHQQLLHHRQQQRELQARERREAGQLNQQLERLRLELRRLQDTPASARHLELETRQRQLWQQAQVLRAELNAEHQRLADTHLLMRLPDGALHAQPLVDIIAISQPNALNGGQKLLHALHNGWRFLSEYPREANTEGGIFPALFGTVTMVLLMSVMVTPVGVLAAIYLHEYARQNLLTRLIRICVYNLAGIPSIVFGVFGLGFFIYVAGAGIDRHFFADTLPAPTYGTPGLFWVSLTLALLTLPVVIVAMEEGLSRIPHSLREGSLALGATHTETLRRVVLPLATPAMMTGLILAVARAAGEVAPLMLVGVVKMAPSLPVDDLFPHIHPERKIMHLGYHIFDVAFQSPNAEGALSLAFATALVLVLLIILLNLAAISIRNRLRERFKHYYD